MDRSHPKHLDHAPIAFAEANERTKRIVVTLHGHGKIGKPSPRPTARCHLNQPFCRKNSSSHLSKAQVSRPLQFEKTANIKFSTSRKSAFSKMHPLNEAPAKSAS